MVYSERRGRIVDYLGTHEHLAVDLDVWADDNGALCIRSGAQRFYEKVLGFSWPMLMSGVANVRESFDESIDRFRISVDVRSARFGPRFGYRGTFQCDWLELSDAELPARLLPRRQEDRD